MAAAIRDRFANVASIQTVQNGANILSFGSLATNMGFLGRRDQALAMIIDEIQYNPTVAGIQLMTVAGDQLALAITDSDQVTNITDLTDRRVLDFHEVSRLASSAVGFEQVHLPWRKQFFPPLITAARSLFLAIDSVGLASSVTVSAKILFRVETLTGAELVELSEVFRLTG